MMNPSEGDGSWQGLHIVGDGPWTSRNLESYKRGVEGAAPYKEIDTTNPPSCDGGLCGEY